MNNKQMSFDFINITKAHVYLRNNLAGVLEKANSQSYIFSYTEDHIRLEKPAIAISLPVLEKRFESDRLHPFFDNMIAEGWLLAHTEQIFRIDKTNRFALLMATGTAPIGAVRVIPLDENNNEISLEAHYHDNLKSADLEIYLNKPRKSPYCSYCLEPLTDKQKEKSYFHPQCSKKMWDTTRKLKFNLSKRNPMESFLKVIYGGSISGYQKKGLFKLDKGHIKPLSFGAQYVLKPKGDLDQLPENEHLTMAIAKKAGFNVPPFTMLQFEGLGNVFAIRRFDTTDKEQPLRMEDMAQILVRYVDDKYDGSFERVGKAVLKHSSAPVIDIIALWKRILFSYFTANGDMHLKNWSLLEHKQLNGNMALSPCYDLLNTRLPLPQESIDIGLSINGKRKNLQKSYFIKLAENFNIPNRIVDQTFADLEEWMHIAKELTPRSYLSKTAQEEYLIILQERYKILTQ